MKAILLKAIVPSVLGLVASAASHPSVLRKRQDPPSVVSPAGTGTNVTDPVALQADSVPWYKVDPYMQDHIRFHCYLSMASYGDYKSTCPGTFAVDGNEFEVIQEFQSDLGQGGFVARVPLMDKIVIVFKGHPADAHFAWDPVPIQFGHPVAKCGSDCTAASGILALYNSARQATNDWALAKQAVKRTGHKFSVTGHGIGGSVAQLAALDLGSSGDVHYFHSQAAPRTVSPAAATILQNLFQGESSQQVTANNDYFVHLVPRSEHFVRVSTAIRIFGELTQWMQVCNYYPENAVCLGDGTSRKDHFYYFTPAGQCGAADKGF